jgi:DNA topoisomerase-1
MSKGLARRARQHGLKYVEADTLCITRRKSGRGFLYLDKSGRIIRNEKTLARIRALVIPPAWTDVCIAPDDRAHIQAIGKDAEGRLQYRYHDGWISVRDKVKAERLLRFGQALPRIRERIEKDLRRRKTDRRYAAAAAARLIDRALIRSGHRGSEEGGRGAATLLNSDVQLNGTKVTLNFVGKSGKLIRKTFRDPLLLNRLRNLKRRGPKHLFAFRDDDGRRCQLTARDLNEYLRRAAGKRVTAKDFRTFAACAQALATLCRVDPPQSESAAKRIVASTMRQTSEALANTPAVTRSSYVHPIVVEAFAEERLDQSILQGPTRNGLDHAETALMRFLDAELGKPEANSKRS